MTLDAAFDELRFGRRVLNLRATFPAGDEAALRCERWLRQQQVEGAREVLVITGAGTNSPGGVGRVRESVVKLLGRLRREGVVASLQEHTAGSFVVEVAPVTRLFEAPRHRGQPMTRYATPDPATLAGLTPGTKRLLRQLAARALEALGAGAAADSFVRDEMLRQFARLAKGVPQGPDRDARLRAAIEVALVEFEEE